MLSRSKLKFHYERQKLLKRNCCISQKETNTIINSNETNSIDNGFNFGLNETSVSSVNTYDNLYNNVVTKPDNIPVETKDAVDNTNFSMDIFYNGGQ